MSIKRFLSLSQTALVSKKIDSKIVVFESDDWGSKRSSKSIMNKFTDLGVDINKNPYFQFDYLEDKEDIEKLIETLEELKFSTKKKIPIVLNYVMTNPSYSRIRENKYESYYYELFPVTYQRILSNNSPLKLIEEGIEEGYFFPQFHGREHIMVPYWLELLRSGDKVIEYAFLNEISGIGSDIYRGIKRNLQATFDIRNSNDLVFAKNSLEEGLDLFYSVFGFNSESFIPNNYIWPSALNSSLISKGVKYMQGMKLQPFSKPDGQAKREYKLRKAGKRLSPGLLNIVRNTSFEPSFYKDREKELKRCLNEIKYAFLLKQPAVVSTHRINFCGSLVKSNRDENLKLFRILIREITKKWPDVEFMTTTQLGKDYESLST